MATKGTSFPSTISSGVVGSASICSYVPASFSPTSPSPVAESERFVSSMPAKAVRKKIRSLSVGLNQKRCRTSIGPGRRARGTPAVTGRRRTSNVAATSVT